MIDLYGIRFDVPVFSIFLFKMCVEAVLCSRAKHIMRKAILKLLLDKFVIEDNVYLLKKCVLFYWFSLGRSMQDRIF